MSSSISKKIVLVGDAKCGKTIFGQKVIGALPDVRYVPTLGVEVHPYARSPSERVALWDTAGQEIYGGLRDGYYICKDAFIVFCSFNHPESISHVEKWINFVNACDRHETEERHKNVKFAIVAMHSELLGNITNREMSEEWKILKSKYKCYELSAIDHSRADFCKVIDELLA
jgi:GTPase SAR1 family protein